MTVIISTETEDHVGEEAGKLEICWINKLEIMIKFILRILNMDQ